MTRNNQSNAKTTSNIQQHIKQSVAAPAKMMPFKKPGFGGGLTQANSVAVSAAPSEPQSKQPSRRPSLTPQNLKQQTQSKIVIAPPSSSKFKVESIQVAQTKQITKLSKQMMKKLPETVNSRAVAQNTHVPSSSNKSLKRTTSHRDNGDYKVYIKAKTTAVSKVNSNNSSVIRTHERGFGATPNQSSKILQHSSTLKPQVKSNKVTNLHFIPNKFGASSANSQKNLFMSSISHHKPTKSVLISPANGILKKIAITPHKPKNSISGGPNSNSFQTLRVKPTFTNSISSKITPIKTVPPPTVQVRVTATQAGTPSNTEAKSTISQIKKKQQPSQGSTKKQRVRASYTSTPYESGNNEHNRPQNGINPFAVQQHEEQPFYNPMVSFSDIREEIKETESVNEHPIKVQSSSLQPTFNISDSIR